MMNASSIEFEFDNDEQVLEIANEHAKPGSTTVKIRADIQFLRDRINRMKEFNKPHKATLENYENMLKARENVLAWLEQKEKLHGKQKVITLSKSV